MACSDAAAVSFVPSRVEGLTDVTRVVVHADRLEVEIAGRRLAFAWAHIARPRKPGLFQRVLGRRVVVGERDWFHPPSDRFFTWYTSPRLTTFMPVDERADYATSTFRRIEDVLRDGGFMTFDLG